jgi:hypothetical protein
MLTACGGHKWIKNVDILESQLVARLTIIAITASLIGGGIAWLDSRHASASDVSQLKTSIDRERIERIEFEISELERAAQRIKRMPELQQILPDTKARIAEIEARRDRYLRKREELLMEMRK